MPRRTDLHRILIIGSGPIIIGQACEFDYSGTQAAKSLRADGYEVILVNSNPATIMTDPELADRTYVEPLSRQYLEEIIARERPDALLSTVGGQTALNLSVELAEAGVLERYGVELIGAKIDAIKKAEDRLLFKDAMRKIGLETPRSQLVTDVEGALSFAAKHGYPTILRPSFTMGGSGGGIAYNHEDLVTILERGLDLSPVHEVLIEESALGWKEFELEVMRDLADNVIIVCSIENFDPMGVHTGDSITVAPAQTLTDREYQMMRDGAIRCLREIGVDTGGSNVQFAINPDDGRMVIIEMNPRVSRSSALASKATGFPIAKIAAKLAVGYRLDELRNDITRLTPASFEPTIDYIVTKIPRFTFEKFPDADATLTSSMKSVGEVMAIGRTFKESMQKALRSLEVGALGFGGGGKLGGNEKPSDATIKTKLGTPNAERIFYIRYAFKAGYTVEQIFELTKIDPWFLHHLREIHEMEDEIAGLLPHTLDTDLFRRAKQFGFSDAQIAHLTKADLASVRADRKRRGIVTTFRLVDTCAAEFEAFTPYYYSSYGEENEVMPSGRRKIMILGGGPNRIGQGIEFDYCCVHASFALREAGFETVMVNSNPETVSTDYDTSDRLYFEPLTLEDVLEVYQQEGCEGAIVQFGGQTPLNLASALKANGVNVIGTSPESIEVAEDRRLFAAVLDKLGLRQPANRTALSEGEAEAFALEVGYPVLLRPSFVLGGRGMFVVYDEADLRAVVRQVFEVMPGKPVLIDKFLEDAIELDVDCLSDGKTSVIGGMLEHIEFAGVHSGDAAMVMPPHTLGKEMLASVRAATYALARELGVVGLMNVQFAIKDNQLYVLEVNPRASRTVPFVAKAIGIPLAKLAAKVMAGMKLQELGFTREVVPKHWCVKEAVFPFVRFPGATIALGPEMRSTGEVMGLGADLGIAFAKSQMAASSPLPASGKVFISVSDAHKTEVAAVAKSFSDLGFELVATGGTAAVLEKAGLKVQRVLKLLEGRPNIVDFLKNKEIQFVINTPSGAAPREDEIKIRTTAVYTGTPIATTLSGARAAALGIAALKKSGYGVKTIQEYH